MTTIKTVPLSRVEPNPHRDLKTYPFVEGKVAALVKSIGEVGLWEGVIARPHPEKADTYQAAFGHHRLEAAKRAGLTVANVIVRDDLDDALMLKFMGRENGEDYNADFLMLLETWEAAEKFMLASHGNHSGQAVVIARFLGWTDDRDGRTDILNKTALACSSAAKLIADGIVIRDSLAGLAVRSVVEICGRASSRLKLLEKDIASQKLPPQDARAIKKAIVSGTQGALSARAAGQMTDNMAAAHVDSAVAQSTAAPKAPRLFSATIDSLTGIVNGLAKTDATGIKMQDLKVALRDPEVTQEAAVAQSVADLRDAFAGLAKRAKGYESDLDPAKVTAFRLKVVN